MRERYTWQLQLDLQQVASLSSCQLTCNLHKAASQRHLASKRHFGNLTFTSPFSKVAFTSFVCDGAKGKKMDGGIPDGSCFPSLEGWCDLKHDAYGPRFWSPHIVVIYAKAQWKNCRSLCQ